MMVIINYIKNITRAALISVLLFSGQVFSQENIATVLQSTGVDANGVTDVQKITQAYMNPFGNALGVYMNSGWYNTGAPHQLLGFDVTCTFNTILVPNLDTSYNIAKLNLNNVIVASGATAPTIFGENSAGPRCSTIVPDQLHPYDTIYYNLPAGTGISALFMPTFQVGIGIMKNTDLTFRYIPKLETPGKKITGKFSSWGVGLRHDLLQWLPGGKVLPFSLSLMGAYSQMNFGAEFPGALVPGSGITYKDGSTPKTGTYDDQEFDVDVKAWNVNAILSKKILALTIYVGGGYQSSVAEYSLKGTYPIPDVYCDYVNPPKPIVVDKKDPLTFTDKKLAYFKGNVGLRLNFAIVTLHADYTFGKYRVISGGLGISFR